MTYSIHNLSKKQLQVIQDATELLLRVQLGQWHRIMDHLPLKEDIDYNNLHGTTDLIARLLSNFMDHNIDGVSSSLSIGNDNLPESTTIAVDIHDVIRHNLSWENANEKRLTDTNGVNYDKPFHWSGEPLPVIEKTS
jgi:hypothetical protein